MTTTQPEGQPSTDVHHLEAQRRANRDALAKLGLEPYGHAQPDVTSASRVRELFDPAAAEEQATRGKEPGFVDRRPRVTVAGRVVLLRDNGKLIWMNLRDHTGDIQVAVSQRDCASPGFDAAKLTDLADIVVCTGRIMKTKTGEITVWAERFEPASKGLVPPPAKHEGLADVEIRYRQRYVDLWSNPEALRVFELRSRLIAEIRRFLGERDYLEVETPMLQALAGGAAARPFRTHLNALSMDVFLRIAPELYLKRLLVGGFPRVYELNRNFRNEGLDKRHNPEFTVVEVYQAFGDYHSMMELAESLIRQLARVAVAFHARPADASPAQPEGSLRLPYNDLVIDYGPAFRRVTYAALFESALGFPMTDVARARAELLRRTTKPGASPADAEAHRRGIEGMDAALVINELFEEYAEPTLDPAVPTFVTDYPAAISPLTRPSRSNPALAERWDLFIGGMEIGPAYTELNDPDIQEAKFREQLAGLDDDTAAEENTFRTLDHDFLRALKVGMPPAGGLGLGIDRLVMLLADQRSIRDVILFPFMRPEDQPAKA